MGKAKILLVDDEPDFRTLLSFDIKKQGYDVVTATDGDEGLAKIASEKPDLVIFDIKMPKMDGYTFVKEVRKDPDMAGLPMIALTSFEPMREMFEMEGVCDYFVKAAKMDGLFELMEKRLNPS